MFTPVVLSTEGGALGAEQPKEVLTLTSPLWRLWGQGDYIITGEEHWHCDRPVYWNRQGFQLYSMGSYSGAWAVSGTAQDLKLKTCGMEDWQPYIICVNQEVARGGKRSPDLCQQWLFRDPDDGHRYNTGYISVVVKK